MPTRRALKRKAFGQHFLKDPGICRNIVEEFVGRALEIGLHHVLEIGPGRGALTHPLIEAMDSDRSFESLTICERDRALAADWKREISPHTEGPGLAIKVEEADFLELDENAWLPPEAKLGVISNLPYSAGTAIVVRLARLPQKVPLMVLMFQQEVAMRLRANPSTKHWGSLSVWIQNQWQVTKLVSVPPGAFSPPPKVMSEVIVLTPREAPLIPVSDDQLWEKLVRVCFAHRRKMLRSGLSLQPWRNILVASGVDGTKRAEALTWDEWARLYTAATQQATLR